MLKEKENSMDLSVRKHVLDGEDGCSYDVWTLHPDSYIDELDSSFLLNVLDKLSLFVAKLRRKKVLSTLSLVDSICPDKLIQSIMGINDDVYSNVVALNQKSDNCIVEKYVPIGKRYYRITLFTSEEAAKIAMDNVIECFHRLKRSNLI